MDLPAAATQSFLASIVASANDAIVSKTLEGIVTSWNPAAERLFGYRPEEIIGRPITTLFPPDRLHEEVDILARIRSGQRVEHYETIRRTKAGELIEVSVSISPIREPSGRIIGASKIVRDMRPVRHAAEQYRATLASIGDGVIATDMHGRVTFMNPVAESLTGWPAADAAGRSIEEVFRIVNEQSRHVVESPVAKVLRDGHTIGLANHTALIARDGFERPIDDAAAPIRTATGQLLGVVLVFRDVTDRRAAQLTAARLAAIVEGSHDAVISKNLEGVITSWNSAAERIFGYTAAEMIGRPISTLFPPDRLDEERGIIERLQRGERVEHFETVRVRKDGRPVEVALTISPMRDDEDRIIGASKIVRDITQQKAAERALVQAQNRLTAHAAELEELVRQRTQELERMAAEAQAFSYSLSHDIRAPLRTIQGFADLVLAEAGEKMPEAVDYLRRIMRAAQRMDRLLTDVLAFSRVAQNQITLEPLNPQAIVRDIIAERRQLQPPAAEIVVAEPLDPVLGNSASLTQCLVNLLDNAVKFVPRGVSPQVRVFTVSNGTHVRLCVQDNGIGVAPANQQKLFRVFERLHTQEQYEGTGLGLAIVRRAAERMGGSVGVESAPGVGSTFWIELAPAPK